MRAAASVIIGRRRLPPDEMRWLATSGIISTSEPARDRIISFTRPISAFVRSTRGWTDPSCFFFPSRFKTTPNVVTPSCWPHYVCGSECSRRLKAPCTPKLFIQSLFTIEGSSCQCGLLITHCRNDRTYAHKWFRIAVRRRSADERGGHHLFHCRHEYEHPRRFAWHYTEAVSGRRRQAGRSPALSHRRWLGTRIKRPWQITFPRISLTR